MTDTYKKISETIKNENDIKITDKRVVMPIRKAMIDYFFKTLKYKFNNAACSKSRITNGSFSPKSGIVTKKCQESVKFLGKL